MLDPTFVEMLACPACKLPVAEQGDRLVCGRCGRRYPVRDGIPIMLIDEAEGPARETEGPSRPAERA